MPTISVKTNVTDEESGQTITREVAFEQDFGSDLKEALEKHGEDLVYNYFRQQAVLRVQGAVRGALQQGKTDEEAIAIGENFELGVSQRAPGGSGAIKKLAEQVKSGRLSRDELMALLSQAMESDEDE